ncbi:MarR family winged helix-turn-helix transcriptional regulator [uncultured Thomasclavelia sp.]|uniref:MarR family winged helix-turn-helix transcriptional regulator n=1 Tax=uncultured Thomasclavelia sp. TaxID=3025759 RepID=UPI0025EE9E34|nr:transcriptional regulator [uncultured Thomasclavelia sp.]
MDYEQMADELVRMRLSQPQVKIEREMAKSTKGEAWLLGYLIEHHNHAYPKELSKGMLASTARIAVMLNNLEKKGYISRQVDPNDNRQIVVSLTSEGLQICQKFRDKIKQHIIFLFEQLGEKDAKEYLRLQKKILEIYSRD